jgi:hypothetical protein
MMISRAFDDASASKLHRPECLSRRTGFLAKIERGIGP